MRVFRFLLAGCIGTALCILLLSSFSDTPSSSRTALESFVAHTHHHLSTLQNLKAELEGNSGLDEKFLYTLGFVSDPVFYPNHTWNNLSVPVIVSAVSSQDLWHLDALILFAQTLSSKASLIIYSLDLDSSEIKQELLIRAGIVLWIDPDVRFTPSWEVRVSSIIEHEKNDLLAVWGRNIEQKSGILSWSLALPNHLPTAALTHPNMFLTFHARRDDFYFDEMADPGMLLLYNFKHIHSQLMKPWLTCALTLTCINPIGAQDTGCRYDKKPLYRYSGCHLYDISAFNVAAGLAFSHMSKSYMSEDHIFYRTSRIKSSVFEENRGDEGGFSSHVSWHNGYDINHEEKINKTNFRKLVLYLNNQVPSKMNLTLDIPINNISEFAHKKKLQKSVRSASHILQKIQRDYNNV